MNKKKKNPPYIDEDSTNCPKCGSSWVGSEIPEKNRHFYGNKTHFSRLIGIEIQGVYDGVLYWKCPDCNVEFSRFKHNVG